MKSGPGGPVTIETRETGGFPPSARLRTSRDFQRVMRQGRRRSDRNLVVIASPLVGSEVAGASDGSTRRRSGRILPRGRRSRIGITISRKVGNAVCRNRFKRRVREWFRLNRAAFREDLEIVVIARKSAGDLGWVELDRSLSKLLELPQSVRGRG